MRARGAPTRPGAALLSIDRLAETISKSRPAAARGARALARSLALNGIGRGMIASGDMMNRLIGFVRSISHTHTLAALSMGRPAPRRAAPSRGNASGRSCASNSRNNNTGARLQSGETGERARALDIYRTALPTNKRLHTHELRGRPALANGRAPKEAAFSFGSDAEDRRKMFSPFEPLH